jgi:hypothetical protein
MINRCFDKLVYSVEMSKLGKFKHAVGLIIYHERELASEREQSTLKLRKLQQHLQALPLVARRQCDGGQHRQPEVVVVVRGEYLLL